VPRFPAAVRPPVLLPANCRATSARPSASWLVPVCPLRTPLQQDRIDAGSWTARPYVTFGDSRMADKTLIAWTDHTFNIAWGCTKVSPGCANCYADTLSGRYGWDVWGPHKPRRTFGAKHWAEPLKWQRLAERSAPGVLGEGHPRLVFSSSMCDW